ncbi:MAG: type II toxin-antitoxin system RelE/ParE family toxin [bacterium]|nr:type II toxin-antitoxin system RelE/ParE family toxin [bacterium]
MENKYQLVLYDPVIEFLRELPPKDRSKIDATVQVMLGGDLHSPRIKTLRGQIKELIVKEYRVTFFIHGQIIYFIRAFRKKSAKTPRREIEYAEQIYKLITNA